MLRATLAGAMLAILLTGCAGMPGGTSDYESLVNTIALDDDTALREAVRSGGLDVNRSIPTSGHPEGAPLIAVAARHGSVRVTRFLISAGANVNLRTGNGETALMLAAYFNSDGDRGDSGSQDRQERIARMLIDAGAHLENEPNSYTPLGYAAYQGNVRIVRYLLERGARVDADAEDGTAYLATPLMMATMQGHADTAQWLLRAGADPRVRVYRGHTAAELALKYNHARLFHLLRCAETLPPGRKSLDRCAPR